MTRRKERRRAGPPKASVSVFSSRVNVGRGLTLCHHKLDHQDNFAVMKRAERSKGPNETRLQYVACEYAHQCLSARDGLPSVCSRTSHSSPPLVSLVSGGDGEAYPVPPELAAWMVSG